LGQCGCQADWCVVLTAARLVWLCWCGVDQGGRFDQGGRKFACASQSLVLRRGPLLVLWGCSTRGRAGRGRVGRAESMRVHQCLCVVCVVWGDSAAVSCLSQGVHCCQLWWQWARRCHAARITAVRWWLLLLLSCLVCDNITMLEPCSCLGGSVGEVGGSMWVTCVGGVGACRAAPVVSGA
jgi:hypothetical protein